MPEYLIEALSCAFEEAGHWLEWNAIPTDKQAEIAAAIRISIEMESEMASYSRPSASDIIASRERELKAAHARELADLDDRRQREERDARHAIGRLQNRIYEMQRDMGER